MDFLSFLNEFGPGSPQDKIFKNSLGNAHTEAPHHFRQAIQDTNLNEGRERLDRFSFHNLRHMAASDLARVMPLRDLMDYMGWKVSAVALRYMHGNEEAQRAAIAAREAQLSQKQSKVTLFPSVIVENAG